jgi:CrcB protein
VSLPDVLLVSAGAAVGAPLRYLTDRAVQGRTDATFPWGTFTVNVLGSFVLGVVAGLAVHDLTLLAGVGFCGAFTTFSTFGYETDRLAAAGSRLTAALNVGVTVAAGLTVAALGYVLGTHL